MAHAVAMLQVSTIATWSEMLPLQSKNVISPGA